MQGHGCASTLHTVGVCVQYVPIQLTWLDGYRLEINEMQPRHYRPHRHQKWKWSLCNQYILSSLSPPPSSICWFRQFNRRYECKQQDRQWGGKNYNKLSMKNKNNPFLQCIHTDHITISSFIVFHYQWTRAKAQSYTQIPMHFALSEQLMPISPYGL